MGEIFSLDEFKGNNLLMKPIEAYANWNGQYFEFQWNNSSILTELIQAAGRWCERFASDLFISWANIEKQIANGDYTVELLGFRRDGVDHTQFVSARAITERVSSVYSLDRIYRALYKLTVERTTELDVKITLERVI